MEVDQPSEEDDAPRVGRKAIILADERISLKSPRLVAAMKTTGVTIDELRPIPEAEIVRNVKLTEIAHRRKQAFESQQRQVLSLVLKTREGIIESKAAAAARKEKAAAAGVPAAGAGSGDDLSTMLAQEQEHMQKILEATQRRIAGEKAKLEAAEALAKRRMEDQLKLDENMKQRQAEHKKEVQKRRAENLQKQLEREAQQVQEAAEAVEKERAAEMVRIERDTQIERARRRREKEAREKALAFAREHDRKMQVILDRQAKKQEKLAMINVETAAKMRESELKRLAKVAEQKQKIMLENKLRNEENEKRRKERHAMDQKRMLQKEEEIKAHLDAVDRRLSSVEADKLRTLRNKREIEEAKEAERLAKLEALERQRTMSEGDMMGKAEAKEAAIDRALRRREQQLEIKAEESRLKFDGKRRYVARMHRKQVHELDEAKQRIMEKSQRIEDKNAAKERLKAERRRMAQQFFVQQRQLRDEAERSRLRASSATPTSGMTAAQQREAMKRLSDLGNKGIPGDQPFWKRN